MILAKFTPLTLIWLFLCFIVFVGRFFVPTHIEWTTTAFYKAIVHIWLGCLLTYAVMRRKVVMEYWDKGDIWQYTTKDPSYFLFGVGIALSLFELGMALAFGNF